MHRMNLLLLKVEKRGQDRSDTLCHVSLRISSNGSVHITSPSATYRRRKSRKFHVRGDRTQHRSGLLQVAGQCRRGRVGIGHVLFLWHLSGFSERIEHWQIEIGVAAGRAELGCCCHTIGGSKGPDFFFRAR